MSPETAGLPGGTASRTATGGPVVVLVGPPGSGKTTTGAALSRLLEVALRDVDADIETSTGQTIPDIFLHEGEAEFRRLERLAVAAALATHTGVLSVGGGAILAPQTRELMRGHRVVFLNLSMPVGVRRTGLATNRPLLVGINPRATYKALLDERLPLYREVAVLEVNTDELSAAEIAATIAEKLELT